VSTESHTAHDPALRSCCANAHRCHFHLQSTATVLSLTATQLNSKIVHLVHPEVALPLTLSRLVLFSIFLTLYAFTPSSTIDSSLDFSRTCTLCISDSHHSPSASLQAIVSEPAPNTSLLRHRTSLNTRGLRLEHRHSPAFGARTSFLRLPPCRNEHPRVPPQTCPSQNIHPHSPEGHPSPCLRASLRPS
jgi:hypothetical protein